MKRPKHQPFARLSHPEASPVRSPVPRSLLPLWALRPPVPSPRIPDTGRSRSPPLGRPRPIGMHPGPPPSEPSSSAGAPSSSTPSPRTVYAGFEQGSVKGKPSPQATMGTGKGPSKSSKGDASPLTQDTPFFTVAPQKGKDAAPKGERKARIKARTRVAIKARVKVKVRTKKVDRTRSPPFRLVLGRVFNLLLCFTGMLLPPLAAI